MYDPRIGRFLSVDLLTGSYPDISPYLYAEDNPIYLIDIEGMAAGDFHTVDPPTKQGPALRNQSVKKSPDPHHVNAGGRIIKDIFRNSYATRGGWTLFTYLLFKPLSAGEGSSKPDTHEPSADEILKDIMHLTNDPANDLSDDEKKALQERINSGMASQNDKLQHRMLGLATEGITENVANLIGNQREALAALMSGGEIAKKDGRDMKLSIMGPNNQLISATIDVVGANGELITVGGASKAKSLSHWGDHLSRMSKIATARGVKAQAYLDSNSPQNLIDFTRKKLGDENVIIMPKQ